MNQSSNFERFLDSKVTRKLLNRRCAKCRVYLFESFFSSLFSRAVNVRESWASAPEGTRASFQARSPSVAKAGKMTATHGTAEAVPFQSVSSSGIIQLLPRLVDLHQFRNCSSRDYPRKILERARPILRLITNCGEYAPSVPTLRLQPCDGRPWRSSGV